MMSCWLALMPVTSCNFLFIDRDSDNTPLNNFNLLWKIIDERYCFFDEKGVDWNMMYNRYSAEMIGYDAGQEYLFFMMARMLEELKDGHVVLEYGELSSSYNGWYSAYPDNFDSNRISKYKNKNTVYINNGTFFTVLSEEPVGYVRCASFSEKFNRNELDAAMSMFSGVKGVIVDVRNNGGGLVSEAFLLASKFVDRKTHAGYARYKTGKGHNDFSDFFARYIEPEGANRFCGNVAVITNRRVYSAANMFVSAMDCLPHVSIVGDNTGGGGGVPISAELYNGWTVRFSTNPVFDINKQSIEAGVEPDIHIALDKNTKNDNIIEKAKSWILAKQGNQD
jgi:hypothetical protein